MADELMHDLAAGYALDALSPDEERLFEAHLAHCPSCQAAVAAFVETAAELAFASPPVQEPAELRDRILAAARREGGTVVAIRPRWAYPALAAAAVAACLAIGFGVWAAVLQSRQASVAALRGIPVRGAAGSIVVGPHGEAALVVSGMAPPPAGKTYELWVMRGAAAEPAGLFAPHGKGTVVVRLTRRVPRGARVGVTVEPAGGSPRPTTRPIVVSAPL
ncbi:MAG TPA: anti-sigma factor [Gaiellaceae bacterium]|nr:anti-sigma factor [Gaiellaceae bacterium]